MSTIRDILDVRPHPTVVRLDDLDGDGGDWISASYYLTADVKTHLAALRGALGRLTGCGAFLVGPYGSGKSHFLAYLIEQLRREVFTSSRPAVVSLSLLNFRSDMALEDVVSMTLGLEAQPGDRRDAWRSVMRHHRRGLVLVIDELSEFLRSKPSREHFNEDVRFLQFLGEWSQDEPFWVVAAMQEQIEHTGDLEHGIYRKIKDRFPLRLLLTAVHVRDVVAETILVKRPDYDAAVSKLAAELRSALPKADVDWERLRLIYPLHPATLDLLEELRDRFSQARGAIDFTVSQLNGDARRNIEPFLDQPFGALLTPDVVVTHFRDLFELQPEFLPLSQQLLPYYRRHLPEIFETERAQTLAWRVLRLLMLVHLAPARRSGLALHDAVSWLLPTVSRIDPARNQRIVERVLGRLVSHGRFVTVSGERFRLDLADDGGMAFERLLEREISELDGRGEVVFETLTELLDGDAFNPFSLPREQWQPHTVRWHFHERRYAVYFGNDTPQPAPDAVALCVRPPWGPAQAVVNLPTLIPAPLILSPEVLELAAMVRLRTRSLSPDSNTRLEKRLGQRASLFRSQVRQAYAQASLLSGSGGVPTRTPVSIEPRTTTKSWCDLLATVLLRRRYPSFEKFAPTHGPLPTEAYRSFMRWSTGSDLGGSDTLEYVRLVQEAYLVPMRLTKRSGADYVPAPRMENHPLVKQVTSSLAHEPAPKMLYEHLQGPVYGLVPDQIHLLLVFLLLQGEVDIVAGGRSYRQVYKTLPLPSQYERVTPALSLRPEELDQLRRICEGFDIKAPKDWTVLMQRRVVSQLMEVGKRQREGLSKLLFDLKDRDDAQGLRESAASLRAQWSALDRGNGPLDAARHLLFEVGSVSRFVAQARELEALPGRLDQQIRRRDRFQHLLGHPAVFAFSAPALAERIEALNAPPPLDAGNDLDAWLSRAEGLYQQYCEAYSEGHTAFWEGLQSHPIWTYRVPVLSRSRVVGLTTEATRLEALATEAERARCRHLVNLALQPVCHCGFDGERASLTQILERFTEERESLESELRLTFARDEVQQKVRTWAGERVGAGQPAHAYLEGAAAWPEVDDLTHFDDCLVGLDTVERVPIAHLVDVLCERAWDRRTLTTVIDELLPSAEVGRFRFTHGAKPTSELPDDARAEQLVVWAARQALRYGDPLPFTLSPVEAALLTDGLEASWVTEVGVRRLEALRLGDEVVDAVLALLLDGHIEPPSRDGAGPLVAAALEVLQPTEVKTPQRLAELSGSLYTHYTRLLPLAAERWLARLDAVATTPLTETPPSLVEVLDEVVDAQWLLIDCLGAPLVGSFTAELESLLPAWRLAAFRWAWVSNKTTTHGCYQELAKGGVQHPLDKINCLDRLIHERFMPLDHLARLALAEIRLVLGNLRRQLDPSRPLVVFADHGFRMASDGRSYTHGGASTLERLVPVYELSPG